MEVTRYDGIGKPALQNLEVLGTTAEGFEILRDRGNTDMAVFDPATRVMRRWVMYAIYGGGPIEDDWGVICQKLGWYQIGQTASGQPVYDFSESPYGSAYPRQGEHPWMLMVDDPTWVSPYRPAPPPPPPPPPPPSAPVLIPSWFRRLFRRR